jgi:hypothetical protein
MRWRSHCDYRPPGSAKSSAASAGSRRKRRGASPGTSAAPPPYGCALRSPMISRAPKPNSPRKSPPRSRRPPPDQLSRLLLCLAAAGPRLNGVHAAPSEVRAISVPEKSSAPGERPVRSTGCGVKGTDPGVPARRAVPQFGRDAAHPQATEIRRDMPFSGHSAAGPIFAELGGKQRFDPSTPNTREAPKAAVHEALSRKPVI